MIERSVHVAQTDRKWDFFESGEPLPEEDIAGYDAAKKRDRLNERRTIDLLARLGAEPWNEAFYAFPGDAIAMTRPTPAKAVRRSRAEVLRPR